MFMLSHREALLAALNVGLDLSFKCRIKIISHDKQNSFCSQSATQTSVTFLNFRYQSLFHT